MNATGTVRILIADDHPSVREGLAAIFNRYPDLQVVAEASKGEEVLDLFRLHQPDVVLLDLRMPGLDGIESLVALRAEFPTARVVILSCFDRDEDIYASVRAGASAYLVKDVAAEELLDTVRAVSRGETLLAPAIFAKLAGRMSRPTLTRRELEVLQCIAAGKSNQEIGNELFICEGTVKSHVNSLLSKLQVTDRTQAAMTAVKSGLIRLD